MDKQRFLATLTIKTSQGEFETKPTKPFFIQVENEEIKFYVTGVNIYEGAKGEEKFDIKIPVKNFKN